MSAAGRWAGLTALALAAILLPFVFFEAQITAWTQSYVQAESSRLAAAVVLGGLLASDVFLPVPSSLVSTACGYVLGFSVGLLTSWSGMSLGALLGYALGRRPARALAARIVGEKELRRAAAAHERWGDWALAVCRAVPVVAEASVVFAGVAGMPLRRFASITGLANLGISAVYAAVGAWAMEAESFLLAFAAAVTLPAAAMAFDRLWRRTHS